MPRRRVPLVAAPSRPDGPAGSGLQLPAGVRHRPRQLCHILLLPRRHHAPYLTFVGLVVRRRRQRGERRVRLLAGEIDPVDPRPVRVEDAPVPLRPRTGFLVLVEQGEDERGDRRPWPRRCAGRRLGGHPSGQVAIKDRGVADIGTDLVVVAGVGPPRLGDDQGNVPVTQASHGREDGVELLVEEVGVGQPAAGVCVGLRPLHHQRVVEGDGGGVRRPGEVRVDVEEKEGAAAQEETEQGDHHRVGDIGAEDAGGGGEGGPQGVHGDGGADLHAAEGVGLQGAAQPLHGRHEMRPGGVADGVVGEDLVSDEEEAEADGGAERDQVRGDPVVGEGLVGGGGGDELVGEHDGSLDLGADEGGQDGGVGVVQLDAGGADGAQELHGAGRRGKVAAQLAVVHAERAADGRLRSDGAEDDDDDYQQRQLQMQVNLAKESHLGSHSQPPSDSVVFSPA